jgi:hypothetical protein
LLDAKAIGERLTGLDRNEATETGNAIHVGGHEQTVPMHRTRLGELVGDVNERDFAFGEMKGGTRHGAIDAQAFKRLATDGELQLIEHEPVFFGACGRRDRQPEGYCREPY